MGYIDFIGVYILPAADARLRPCRPKAASRPLHAYKKGKARYESKTQYATRILLIYVSYQILLGTPHVQTSFDAIKVLRASEGVRVCSKAN